MRHMAPIALSISTIAFRFVSDLKIIESLTIDMIGEIDGMIDGMIDDVQFQMGLGIDN